MLKKTITFNKKIKLKQKKLYIFKETTQILFIIVITINKYTYIINKYMTE